MSDAPNLRNDGLHPRHPGFGCSTTFIELESGDGRPEVGGFLAFFPSGTTKIVTWHTTSPIVETKKAAKQYAASLAEAILKSGSNVDLDRTNWTSAVAAIQRIIMDFNRKLKKRIGAKMAESFGGDPTRLMH